MATLNTTGANTTVTLDYTAPNATMLSVVGGAAEYLWKEVTDAEGVVTNPFVDATNQEKLDVVDAHVKQVIMDLANTQKSVKAQTLARETEEASKYSI